MGLREGWFKNSRLVYRLGILFLPIMLTACSGQAVLNSIVQMPKYEFNSVEKCLDAERISVQMAGAQIRDGGSSGLLPVDGLHAFFNSTLIKLEALNQAATLHNGLLSDPQPCQVVTDLLDKQKNLSIDLDFLLAEFHSLCENSQFLASGIVHGAATGNGSEGKGSYKCETRQIGGAAVLLSLKRLESARPPLFRHWWRRIPTTILIVVGVMALTVEILSAIAYVMNN